jgi:MOSC domain-containing protein YiiM
VLAVPGRGLVGDHRAEKSREGDALRKREITLIQAEHLPVAARLAGLPDLRAEQVRRNLVLSGVNVLAMHSGFPGQRLVWQVGESACIVVTGPCAPCSWMEQELGPGGYNAMRGHGGMTGMVVAEGRIRVGDKVVLLRVEQDGVEPRQGMLL